MKGNGRRVFRANINRLRLLAKKRRRLERRREKSLKSMHQIVERRHFSQANNIQFDRNMARLPIIMPMSFSLSNNHEATVGILQEIRELALFEGKQLLLHFEHVEQIEPAAALALCAEIYRVRNLRGRELVSGTYPKSMEVFNALSKMGFFSMLNIREPESFPAGPVDRSKPIYLRFITDNRANWQLADAFVEIVEKQVMQFSDLARQRLVCAIGEAMNNTLDHAHPPEQLKGSMRNRWWLSASINVENKEVVVIVLDQGVGIPKTLKPNEYEQIRAVLANLLHLSLSAQPTDGEMILAATEYRRSGTGSEGRGRGFHDMKDFVDVCSDGELRVLSNRGSFHYIGGEQHFENFERSIEGTLIEWRFRHEGTVDMQDE